MMLEDIIQKLESVPPDKIIKRGLCNPHSWRGDYYDLALEPSENSTTAGELATLLKSCINKTFEGYKGGDFTMFGFTDVHISYVGSSYDHVWDWLLDYLLEA